MNTVLGVNSLERGNP